MRKTAVIFAMTDIADDLILEAQVPVTGKRSRPVGVKITLIAAIVAVLGISAGAVWMSFREQARYDMGIENRDVSEYTEYTENPGATEEMLFSDEVMEQYAVEDARIELISTFCSGDQVAVYLAISPVTPEMAEATQEGMERPPNMAYWHYGFSDFAGTHKECRSAAMASTQIEYDVETQTALIRLDMEGEVFGEAEEMTLSLIWTRETSDSSEAEFKYYGDITIPITRSETLSTLVDIPLENSFLPGLTGKMTAVEVRAGYVTATIEIPSFYEACDMLGENAHYIMGDAYWNYYRAQSGQELDTEFTELDAYVAYKRSWTVSFARDAKDMTLLLQDGSALVVAEQDSMYAGWSIPITDSDDDEVDDYMSETTHTYNYDLITPLELGQIKAVVMGGVEYPLEAR